MADRHVVLPRALDEPPFLLIFRLDDLAVFGLVFGLGFMIDQVALFGGLSCLAAWGYRKMRMGRPEGYLLHLAYWHGLYAERGHSMRNAFVRRLEP